jgi:hypothetical protein
LQLTQEPQGKQNKKSWVIPGKLSFCFCKSNRSKNTNELGIFSVYRTFSVVEISVDFLWRNKQVDHLPESKFKVHLLESEYSSQVLVPFGRSV